MWPASVDSYAMSRRTPEGVNAGVIWSDAMNQWAGPFETWLRTSIATSLCVVDEGQHIQEGG